jgi:alkylhydroperoxidase/carboxymuconolactone decarboxylase family protein YurZ
MAFVPRFVEDYKTIDRQWYDKLQDVIALAMEPGAIDAKTKLLIVLALDSLKGASEGVKAVAGQARALGVTDQEMAEAVRLAYYVAGMDVLKAGTNAFQV